MSGKRRQACYHVVSFYVGDMWKVRARSKDKPMGFVNATIGRRRDAIEYATNLEKRKGEHVYVRAIKCDRAKRLFDLKA
jgi:hypothetical protein